MYGPVKTRSGAVLQSGVPKTRRQGRAGKANGLLLRGVVVVTYVFDDPGHPEVDLDDRATVYCDCVVFTNIPGSRWHLLPSVLVSQDHGGIHRGRVWKPRAASLDITGSAVDMNKATNPANLDGDHVLIGFLNDNLNEPVILKGLPHPAADTGQADEDAGHRLRLKVADGDPDFWKHRGAFYGISDDGDFVADLTQAYATDIGADGKQPTPPADGTTGNYKVKLPAASKLTVEIAGGDSLELDLKDANAKLTLGDGTKSVAVAEWLDALYTTAISGIKAVFDAHVHTSAAPGSPTGTPVLPPAVPVTFPAWNTKIVSNKAKIPDTT
jgi:hypothetical protein